MGVLTNKKAGYLGAARGVPGSSRRICFARYLGVVPYELALERQQRLVQARAESSIPDVILLVQHWPVITIGRFGTEQDIIVAKETLRQEGISIFSTNRGGGVTYHGPGQLIGYPIINLKENNLGVRQYVWQLEAVIIKLLLGLGIHGRRVAQHRGVWVGGKKVCSIGIHVSRGITMHGFALNVNADLHYFEYINPCRIKGNVITSISKLLGQPVEPEAIVEALLGSFSVTFGLEIERGYDKCLSILDYLSG